MNDFFAQMARETAAWEAQHARTWNVVRGGRVVGTVKAAGKAAAMEAARAKHGVACAVAQAKGRR